LVIPSADRRKKIREGGQDEVVIACKPSQRKK
jgi:hypothetical protein